MHKIVIEIAGGVLQAVHSTLSDDEIEISLVDHDNLENATKSERRIAEETLLNCERDMHTIY